jgi:microsomal epoxide hydrolase
MRPFQIAIPQEDIDDLHRRLAAVRWPGEVPGAGWDRGVPVGYLEELAGYWRTTYDWRAAERRLNEYPQFLTEIDGATVHLLHVRSVRPDAPALILTHGWPGSAADFLKVIGPLADDFHVVAPTIPGYGFSSPLVEGGWDTDRVARAWAELMRRLGYERYVAQGGDWGKVISLALAKADPEHVIGVHLNLLVTFPPADDPTAMENLDETDLARLEVGMRFQEEGRGWQHIQSTRPQTLAYGLTDSPVGQLAWIVEKFKEWNRSAKVPEDTVERDELLTNVSIAWFTATAGSSAQLYYESSRGSAQFAQTWGGPWPLPTPVAVAVYGSDAMQPIRRFAKYTQLNITQWSEFDRGSHFPAQEQPELFVDDLRTFARSLQLD